MAEPHPDMNIKVAAFTVSEKASFTVIFETEKVTLLKIVSTMVEATRKPSIFPARN